MRLFTSLELNQARQRAEQDDWAAGKLASMRARMDAWVAQPRAVPALPGGWMHEYVCPSHWNALVFNPDSPQSHRCPHGETHTGEKFDAAWRVHEHRRLVTTARDLALTCALTGEGAYANAARDILVQYADAYAGYAAAGDAQAWMLKGRAFHQALTEALWAVPIAHAFDLIHATLSPKDEVQIITRLLRPIVDTLTASQDELVLHQNQLKSNYDAWLIAALGCLGYALCDDALVEHAVEGPAGFRAHLAAAILPDGFEYEGSPYYHNFVALAYTLLAEAARANGRDLYAVRGPKGQSIQGMWHALASLAFVDGQLPVINDGAYWENGPFAAEICETYHIAHARTGDPEFAWLLDRQGASKRVTWTTLLYADRDVAGAPQPPRASICLSSIGIAVLRDETQAQQVCAAFGPYAGPHSHLDRLGIQIYPWATDPGTPPYGIDERVTWYQQTAAHNAVVVDGKSHAPCQGKLQSWHSTPNATTISLSADDAYVGVHFERVVTLNHGVVQDSVLLDSADEHTCDWIVHIDGECQDDSSVNLSSGKFQTIVQHASKRFGITLNASTPFEIIRAPSPASVQTPAQPRHMLTARSRARRVEFLMTSEIVE